MIKNLHVAAAIRFLNGGDVQVPRVVLVVRDANARIARDDVVLHSQDSRPLHIDPGDLRYSPGFVA